MTPEEKELLVTIAKILEKNRHISEFDQRLIKSALIKIGENPTLEPKPWDC